jgi:hypothetical protein
VENPVENLTASVDPVDLFGVFEKDPQDPQAVHRKFSTDLWKTQLSLF